MTIKTYEDFLKEGFDPAPFDKANNDKIDGFVSKSNSLDEFVSAFCDNFDFENSEVSEEEVKDFIKSSMDENWKEIMNLECMKKALREHYME